MLLLAEILFLTLRFDTTVFADRTDLPSRIVAAMPAVLQIAIGTTTASFMLIVWQLRYRFGQAVQELNLQSGAWPWLPAHLSFFAVLMWASTHVLGTIRGSNSSEVLGWLGAATFTALSWIAAALPPRFWPRLIRKGRGVLLAGAAIGLGGWALGRLVRSSWEASAAPTFWLADCILGLIYSEVVSDPDRFIVGTPSFRVRIASACSGYEGVCLVSLYLCIYLVVFRRILRFPRAVWLVPIGALSAWILNVFRIALLVIIGDSGSPELALGGFHSQAGWLAFNAVALGLTFVAHRSRLFAAVPAHGVTGTDPTTALLLPLLTIVALQMLTEAFFNGSAALYPLRAIAGAAVLVYFHRSTRCSCCRSGSEVEGRGIWCAVLIGVGVFVLWVALDRLAPASDDLSDPLGALAGIADWAVAVWLVLRVIGSVVVVPLAEELAFRGYLLRRLIAADFSAVSPRQFTWASFLISSVLFGLLHGHWVAGTLAGMAYATVLYRRGRLSDCVLAHAVTNGLLAVTALTTNNWSFWS